MTSNECELNFRKIRFVVKGNSKTYFMLKRQSKNRSHKHKVVLSNIEQRHQVRVTKTFENIRILFCNNELLLVAHTRQILCPSKLYFCLFDVKTVIICGVTRANVFKILPSQ